MRLPYFLLHYNLFYMYLRLRYVVLKILMANMYFGANSRCRIENSVEKVALFLHPLYIIGLKIVPRDITAFNSLNIKIKKHYNKHGKIMAAPSRPVRNCLYDRHIGCTRRHSWRAGERSRSRGVRSVARRALTLLNAPQIRHRNCTHPCGTTTHSL